jgi:hypothetical protein
MSSRSWRGIVDASAVSRRATPPNLEFRTFSLPAESVLIKGYPSVQSDGNGRDTPPRGAWARTHDRPPSRRGSWRIDHRRERGSRKTRYLQGHSRAVSVVRVRGGRTPLQRTMARPIVFASVPNQIAWLARSKTMCRTEPAPLGMDVIEKNSSDRGSKPTMRFGWVPVSTNQT